jgi:hypothetical protein
MLAISSNNVRESIIVFFFFVIASGIVGWCIQQDGTVRRKLAKLLENKTDVHFVNSLPSEEGVEQVFNSFAISPDLF